MHSEAERCIEPSETVGSKRFQDSVGKLVRQLHLAGSRSGVREHVEILWLELDATKAVVNDQATSGFSGGQVLVY